MYEKVINQSILPQVNWIHVDGVASVDVSVALTQPKGRGQIFMLDLQGFLQLLTICTLNFSNVTSLLHNGL